MTAHALLNPQDHGDLCVLTDRSASLGDAVMQAACFPFEFRSVAAHYPILFHDAGDGQVQAVALFGFQRGENLFLSDRGWEPAYIPVSVERQPFLIGFGSEGRPMIHVDLESPRVTRGNGQGGQPLFDAGAPSAYLRQVGGVLDAMHQGVGEMRTLATALNEAGLLEPLAVDIELIDGSKNRLVGFMAINEEKLATLAPEGIAALHRLGLLMPIYMALASLAQMKPLIDAKNARIRAAANG